MKFIKTLFKKWLFVAKIIGNFQSQVIFAIFYIVALSVFGIIFRFFNDPLVIKKNSISKKKTNFSSWEHLPENVDQARKQF